jgi:DNA-binding MarR family transcriptional regulator
MIEISADTVLRRFLKAIEALRVLDATMQIQSVAALLAAAVEEGQTINEIGRKIDVTPSSASRNLSSLGELDWKKRPGLQLVEYRISPVNLSEKRVYLTSKGKKVIEQLVSILHKELTI